MDKKKNKEEKSTMTDTGRIEKFDPTAEEIAGATFAAADSPLGESGAISNSDLGLAAAMKEEEEKNGTDD